MRYQQPGEPDDTPRNANRPSQRQRMYKTHFLAIASAMAQARREVHRAIDDAAGKHNSQLSDPRAGQVLTEAEHAAARLALDFASVFLAATLRNYAEGFNLEKFKDGCGVIP